MSNNNTNENKKQVAEKLALICKTVWGHKSQEPVAVIRHLIESKVDVATVNDIAFAMGASDMVNDYDLLAIAGYCDSNIPAEKTALIAAIGAGKNNVNTVSNEGTHSAEKEVLEKIKKAILELHLVDPYLVVQACPELRDTLGIKEAYSDDELKTIDEYADGHQKELVEMLIKYADRSLKVLYPGFNMEKLLATRKRGYVNKFTVSAKDGIKVEPNVVMADENQMSRTGIYGSVQEGCLYEKGQKGKVAVQKYANVFPGKAYIEFKSADKLKGKFAKYQTIFMMPEEKQYPILGFLDGKYYDIGDREVPNGRNIVRKNPKHTALTIGFSTSSNTREDTICCLVLQKDYNETVRAAWKAMNEANNGAFDVLERSLAPNQYLAAKASLMKDLGRIGQNESPCNHMCLAHNCVFVPRDYVVDAQGNKNLDGLILGTVENLGSKFKTALGENIPDEKIQRYIAQMRVDTAKGAMPFVPVSMLIQYLQYGIGLNSCDVDGFVAGDSPFEGFVFIRNGGASKAEIQHWKKVLRNKNIVVFNPDVESCSWLSEQLAASNKQFKYKNYCFVTLDAGKDLKDLEMCFDTNSLKLWPDFDLVAKNGMDVNVMTFSEDDPKVKVKLNVQFLQGALFDEAFLKDFQELMINNAQETMELIMKGKIELGQKPTIDSIQDDFWAYTIAKLLGQKALPYSTRVRSLIDAIEAGAKQVSSLDYGEVDGMYLMGLGPIEAMFIKKFLVHNDEIFLGNIDKKTRNALEKLRDPKTGEIWLFLGRTPQSHFGGGMLVKVIFYNDIVKRIKNLGLTVKCSADELVDIDGNVITKDELLNSLQNSLKRFYKNVGAGVIICPSGATAFFQQLDGPDFDGDHYFVIWNKDFVAVMKVAKHFGISYDGNKDGTLVKFDRTNLLRPVISVVFSNTNQGIGLIANISTHVNNFLKVLRDANGATVFIQGLKFLSDQENFAFGSTETNGYERVTKEGTEVTQKVLDEIEKRYRRAMFVPQAENGDDDQLCVRNLIKLFEDLQVAYGGAAGKTIDSMKTLAKVTLCCLRLMRVVKCACTLKIGAKVETTTDDDGKKEYHALLTFGRQENEKIVKDKFEFLRLGMNDDGEAEWRSFDPESFSIEALAGLQWETIDDSQASLINFISRTFMYREKVREDEQPRKWKMLYLDPVFIIKLKTIKDGLLETFNTGMAELNSIPEYERYFRYEVSGENILEAERFAHSMCILHSTMATCHVRNVGVWLKPLKEYTVSMLSHMGFNASEIAKIIANGSLLDSVTGDFVDPITKKQLMGVSYIPGCASFFGRFGFQGIMLCLDKMQNDNAGKRVATDIFKADEETTPLFESRLRCSDIAKIKDGDMIKFKEGKSVLTGRYYVNDRKGQFNGWAKVVTGSEFPRAQLALYDYCVHAAEGMAKTQDIPVFLAVNHNLLEKDGNAIMATIRGSKTVKIVFADNALNMELHCFDVNGTKTAEIALEHPFINNQVPGNRPKNLKMMELLSGKTIKNLEIFYGYKGQSEEVGVLAVTGIIDNALAPKAAPVNLLGALAKMKK